MVQAYLEGMNVSTTGMTITVTNSGTSTTAKSYSYTWNPNGTTSGSGYDPAAASTMFDQLTVTVTLPYTNVAWSPLNWFIGKSTTLTSTSVWLSMNDQPLSVSTTVPAQPYTSASQLP